MVQGPASSLKLIGAGTDFREELCRLIGGIPLLNDMEWSEIEPLADYLQAYQAAKGATVFSEGERGNFMCLLIEGKVDVLKEDRLGVRKVVATVPAGKTLGEMSLIDNELRSASAVVAEPATLVMLTKDNFERLGREHPRLALHFALKLARLLSQRLRQTSGQLVDHLG